MKPTLCEIKLSEVVFDELIYPRKDHDPVLVQRYSEVLDEIEAKQAYLAVSADLKLLDGKHRWLAYRKRHEGNNEHLVKAFRYEVTTPHEQLKLAASLNSDHGWQLTLEDKKRTACTLYSYGCTYEDIAATLSVGKKKISDWLSRTVKEAKERRNRKLFDMWLACHSTEEIAAACACDKATVSRTVDDLLQEVLKNPSQQTVAHHAEVEFELPLYNVWRQQSKTNAVSHFGNSEVRWLDNLLYFYTKPFDVVADFFAGGGSTIDLCRKRFRRYWVSDRKPIVERETEIRPHDVTEGVPRLPWKETKLVYLDPPYWKQAAGQYSQDPTDLANMDLDMFNKTLSELIKRIAKKVSDAYIALIIQPTQWNAPGRRFTDHLGDMLRLVPLPVEMRFSVPYESQQCNAQMVEWAKAHRQPLVLSREIVVWKVT